MSESSLWLAAAGPIATSIAAILVLFGDRLRSLMFRPALKVKLVDVAGLAVPIYAFPAGEAEAPVVTAARWYHLKVENISRGRWPVANDVRVYLAEVKRLGMGAYERVWSGQAPLTLQHERVFNPRRVVGPPMIADLLCVTEQLVLHFAVVAIPNGAPLVFAGGAYLRFKVIANSVETDSQPLFLEALWDGHWNESEAEMRRHLPLRELSAAEYADDTYRSVEPIRG